jgi:hypothetical protein
VGRHIGIGEESKSDLDINSVNITCGSAGQYRFKIGLFRDFR